MIVSFVEYLRALCIVLYTLSEPQRKEDITWQGIDWFKPFCLTRQSSALCAPIAVEF